MALVVWAANPSLSPQGMVSVAKELTDIGLMYNPALSLNYIASAQRLMSGSLRQEDIMALWKGTQSPTEVAQACTYGINKRLLTGLSGVKFSHRLAVLPQVYRYAHGNASRLDIIKYVLSRSMRFDHHTMKTFCEDPALPFCEALMKKELPARDALALGRNLHIAGVSLTKVKALTSTAIEKEKQRRAEVLRQIENVSLFKNRNVVALKEMEWWGGKDRFLDSAMQRAIKKSMGVIGFFGQPGPVSDLVKLTMCQTGKFNDNAAERAAVGKAFLKAIVETPPPTTFLCACHGGPNGFGQFGITDADFALAFRSRVLKWTAPGQPRKFALALKKDIWAANSCYFHTLARTVLHENRKTIRPIVIAGAEYGGFGFTSSGQNNFIYKVLGAGKVDPKIKDVVAAERASGLSDISIYASDSRGRSVQVVKTKRPDDGRRAG